MPPGKPLRKRSLKDDVVDFLLEGVIQKRYLPGDRITEMQVARELEVSQGVVREGFTDFAAMGFLVSVPYKGTYFRDFVPEELEDYYRVRIELESLAVTWATASGGPAEKVVANLRHCVDRIVAKAKEGDYKGQIQADIDFHRSIVETAGSISLLNAWSSLGNYFWFFMHYFAPMDMDREARKHQDLCEALASGSGEKAAELIRQHFSENRRLLQEGRLRPQA